MYEMTVTVDLFFVGNDDGGLRGLSVLFTSHVQSEQILWILEKIRYYNRVVINKQRKKEVSGDRGLLSACHRRPGGNL